MSRERTPPSKRQWLVTAVTVAAATLALAATQGDEPAPVLTASALLPAAVLQGPHYRVSEAVRTETYFHEFTVESDFGTFDAIGRTQLAVRIQEIAALEALRDVSRTEVFLAAAGQSVINIGKGAASVATDPVGTAKGFGGGLKRFAVNLGRRTQRAVEAVGDEEPSADGVQGGKESAAKGILGVTSAMRRWAAKVNVDPYTTNPVLKQALEDVAKVDAAGSIATKVVVPVPAPVGMTASVGGLVWGKDPEEVRKINESRLKDLGVPDAVASGLFKNRWFTLTSQTRLAAALHTVRVEGCADYVRTAAEASSEREALFFVESAELLERWHAREPVGRLLNDSRALVASAAGGRAVLLLPLDWVRWTNAAEAALRDIGTRSGRELGARHVEVVLTGRVSERASRELAALGWTVRQGQASVRGGGYDGAWPSIARSVNASR